MSGYRLQPRVLAALEEIYRYSRENWGKERADDYVDGFFPVFEALAQRRLSRRVIPPHFGVEGFRHRHRRHLIYWRPGAEGKAIVFAILHERMQQGSWLDFTDEDDAP